MILGTGLCTLCRKYLNRETIKIDLVAGLVGTIVVLPQAVAFAMIAGLPPQYGIYVAIVPTIVAALWGSSRHLISGPTTAISLVVFASLEPLAEPGSLDFVTLTITLSFLIGLMQLGLGLGRLGILVRLISPSVVVGFTAGAGLLIATSQLKHSLGLPVPSGSSFVEIIMYVASAWQNLDWILFLLTLLTVNLGILSKKLFPKIPYLITTIIGGTLFTKLLMVLFPTVFAGVPVIGSFPLTLPPLSFPLLDIETIRQLAPAALAITLLGLTEALAIARSIGLRSGQQIDGDREFVGQGLSNLIGSFFSAYPSSGSFNRSGANFDSGARTPIAAVASGVFLASSVLFIAPLVAHLPLSVMAGALLLVSWGIVDILHIRHIIKTDRTETIVMIVTFFSTLILDLEFAIFLGVLLSMTLFLRHVMHADVIEVGEDELTHTLRNITKTPTAHSYPSATILRIDMSIVYLNADLIYSSITRHAKKANATSPTPIEKLIINLSGVNHIDSAGVDMLSNLNAWSKRHSLTLAFLNAKYPIRSAISRNEDLSGVPLIPNIEALHAWVDSGKLISITDRLNK